MFINAHFRKNKRYVQVPKGKTSFGTANFNSEDSGTRADRMKAALHISTRMDESDSP